MTEPVGGVWGWKPGDYQPSSFPSSGAGVQAACDFAGPSGDVYAGPGTYVFASPLTPHAHTRIRGGGYSATASSPSPATIFSAPSGISVLKGNSGIHGVVLEGIGFSGANTTGSRGVELVNCNNWTMRDCFFDTFGDQAVLLTAGAGFYAHNVFIQNAVLVRTGRSNYVGAFEIDTGMSDACLEYVSATPSVLSGGAGSGYICGILMYGSNCFLNNCVGHFGQSGIVTRLGSGHNRLVNCRGEFNQGSGFVWNGSTSELVSCWAYKNSQEGDNLYSGFYVTNGQNNFVACRTDGLSGDTVQQKHGFEDVSAVGTGSTLTNAYPFCRAVVIRGNQFQFTGSTPAAALYYSGTELTTTDKLTVGGIFKANVTSEFVGIPTFDEGATIPYTKPLRWKDSGGTAVTVMTGN